MAGVHQSNNPDPRFKNPVWEQMTTWRFAKYKVRVWSTSPEGGLGPSLPVCEVCRALERQGLSGDVKAIIQALSALESTAAVEVVDSNNNGAVFYPDWS
jgi:hypothetical protein